MPRPRQPLLSQERIVEAALALLDAEGLDAVSTRRLAAELGVSGPSLYNHVATKDELLDAVADTVLGEVDLSMFAGLAPGSRPGWREALHAWAHSYRASLAAHPNIIPVLARGPGRRRPHMLRVADAVFGGLVASGWPRREATHVGALMRFFIIGSALASFAGGFPDDASFYTADYPHLDQAHLLADRSREIDESAFETGLEALLDGLEIRFAGLASG